VDNANAVEYVVPYLYEDDNQSEGSQALKGNQDLASIVSDYEYNYSFDDSERGKKKKNKNNNDSNQDSGSYNNNNQVDPNWVPQVIAYKFQFDN
jgi:hypothetical protein